MYFTLLCLCDFVEHSFWSYVIPILVSLHFLYYAFPSLCICYYVIVYYQYRKFSIVLCLILIIALIIYRVNFFELTSFCRRGI